MEEEIWKPIIGFNGYQANIAGDVMSYKRKFPKILNETGVHQSYTLHGENGEKYNVSKRRIVYSFLHNLNPIDINGHLIGSFDNLRLISKEEFPAYLCQLMTENKKISREKADLFYEESLRDILSIRRFHETGAIADVAEIINHNKEVIIGYILKKERCNMQSASETWSVMQEKILIGICNRSLVVLHIRSYLIRMVRGEIAHKRREKNRIVSYRDCDFYQGF